jgi:Cu+-exporting ATPase
MKKLILFAAALLAACASPMDQASAEAAANQSYSSSYTLTVKGMSCPNCANNITHELKGLPGVEHVQIDMGAGKVTVHSNRTLPEAFLLEDAVRSAGFTPVREGVK